MTSFSKRSGEEERALEEHTSPQTLLKMQEGFLEKVFYFTLLLFLCEVPESLPHAFRAPRKAIIPASWSLPASGARSPSSKAACLLGPRPHPSRPEAGGSSGLVRTSLCVLAWQGAPAGGSGGAPRHHSIPPRTEPCCGGGTWPRAQTALGDRKKRRPTLKPSSL